MKQSTVRSPDVSSTGHSSRNIAEANVNHSSNRRNIFRENKEQEHRRSWNSSASSSSPLNSSIQNAPFVTASRTPTGTSTAEPSVSSEDKKSLCKSCENQTNTCRVDTSVTAGSSISLPLETGCESCENSLKRVMPSTANQPSSESKLQAVGNENKDL